MLSTTDKPKILQTTERYLELDYLFFLDTCALIEDANNNFILLDFLCHQIELEHQLGNINKHLIIPRKVYNELRKHTNNRVDKILARAAQKCLVKIYKLRRKNSCPVIKIYGSKSDNFADNVFIWAFNRFSSRHKLLLITRDHGLAEDICLINKRRACRPIAPVTVLFLGRGPTYLQKSKIEY